MTMLPLVSIVIPAFNHGKFLHAAIDSILNQTYPNIELIVIDDGSTDNTKEVLSNYGDQFFWKSQSNMGQAATLNKGWAMSTGEILAYISADDFLLPEAVAKIVARLLSDSDLVLCYPDFCLVDENSRIIRRIKAPEFDFCKMVSKLQCAPGPGAFFKKEAYLKAGEWNTCLVRFPDYDYWLRLALYGKFEHLSENLASFRVHLGSTSSRSLSEKSADEIIFILKTYFDRINLPQHIYSLKNLAESNAFLVSAQMHFRSGRYFIALNRIHSAIKNKPSIIISLHSYKVLMNGIFYRVAHRILFALYKIYNRYVKS